MHETYCKDCRHFEKFGSSRGACQAFIPLPFWAVEFLKENFRNLVDGELHGKECDAFQKNVSD